MKRIVILGAGESGAGAAVLAKKEGFDVFVSDMSSIKDKYKKLMDDHGIEWEEGHHTEEHIVVVRTIRRRIAMNIDIGDAHILVVLYEVDGGCNLFQLCGILTEVSEDIALVEFEAQVSFTLFGEFLLQFIHRYFCRWIEIGRAHIINYTLIESLAFRVFGSLLQIAHADEKLSGSHLPFHHQTQLMIPLDIIWSRLVLVRLRFLVSTAILPL